MMTDWPEYESHKVVRAAKIVGFDMRDTGGKVCAWVRVAGEEHDGDPFEMFNPTVPAMLDKAEAGDWAMLYPDGFKSVCPAKQFEEGYTRREMSAAQLGAAVRSLGLAGE